MNKNIDIDEQLLKKLELLSVIDGISVNSIIEKAVIFYLEYKEIEILKLLSQEQKEDLGLLLLLQQVDRTDIVPREEVMNKLTS